MEGQLWATSEPSGSAPGKSAVRGQADEIRQKADVRSRKSACYGKAACPNASLAQVLIAEAVEEVGPVRFYVTIVPVT